MQAALRAIVQDAAIEQRFVDRPRRVVRLVVFLLTAAALLGPALGLVGVRLRTVRNPDVAIEWLLDAGLRICLIAVAAYFVVRMGTAAARRFEHEMSRGTGLDVLERTKRAQTLSRLIQKTLSAVVVSIAALMILRELRIDITPVLTGAGILGLAVGFGAQTLVRDILSGFFLILEDQVRVGDVAAINGQGGLVEAINLRTVVLRDEQGAVHVFPSGEIKTLANLSKDFSFYVINVAIAFDADPDIATRAMEEAAASLQQEPLYQPHILAPLEVYGVDAYDQGRLVLKARIKTVPLKQWLVGRELRKRVARRFTELGIHWPAGETTITLRTPPPDERL